MTTGLFKIDGTQLFFRDYNDTERLLTGDVVAGTFTGNLKVKGTYLHYMDNDGTQRRLLGTLTGNTGTAGKLKVKSAALRYIDNSGDERELGVATEVTFEDVNTNVNWGAIVAMDSADLSFADLRAAAGNYVTSATAHRVLLQTRSVTNKWRNLYRVILIFPTVTLPDAAIIISATVRLLGDSKSDGLNISPSINIFEAIPVDPAAIVETDYANLGTIPFCDTPISYANWSTTGWNEFALNALGIVAINKTGLTAFGVRESIYDAGGNAPTWASLQGTQIVFRGPIIGTASEQPRLVVVYT